MSIGEFVKSRRKELGLSADDLAAKIGKNRATVYRYESNYIEKLPVDVLVPLAAALHVTPGDLISKGEALADQKPEPIALTAEEEGLVTKYRRLSPEGRQTVNQYVDFQLFQESEQKRSAADIA